MMVSAAATVLLLLAFAQPSSTLHAAQRRALHAHTCNRIACRAPPARCSAERSSVSEEEDAGAVKLTEDWIEEHVIRLGLCPYAAKPFAGQQIRYAVSDATSDEALIDDFFAEGRLLLSAEDDEIATTMLIAPHYPKGIEGFYWLCAPRQLEAGTCYFCVLLTPAALDTWHIMSAHATSPRHHATSPCHVLASLCGQTNG